MGWPSWMFLLSGFSFQALGVEGMGDVPAGSASSAPVSRRRRGLVATGYMLLAVGGFSLIPLVVGWGDGRENPFLFNAGWRAGVVLGCLFVLLSGNMGLTRSRAVWRYVWQRMPCWPMLFVVVGSFQFALFTWSTRFIDISMAAVFLETWPILLIVLTGRLFRRERRFDGTSSNVLVFVVVGLAGFVFVTASQSADLEFLVGPEGLSLAGLALGVFLAMLAAGTGALEAAFNLRWGVDSSREFSTHTAVSPRDGELDLFFVIVAFAIASAVSFPVHVVAGFLVGEAIDGQGLVIGVIGGGFVQVFSSIFYRKAVLSTDNLGINALGYAIPILSLMWLGLFSHIGVARVDYLVIGAAAIIVSNLLINFEAEIRWGFKALILALLVSGTVVYLGRLSSYSYGSL